MMRTALLVLAMALMGGAPHAGVLLNMVSGVLAAEIMNVGGRYDPNGSTVDVGGGYDPDGSTVDVGGHYDPDGSTADVGSHYDPNG